MKKLHKNGFKRKANTKTNRDKGYRIGQTMLCRSVRWPMTPEMRAETLKRLNDALEMADTARDIAAVCKAIGVLEGQNQADDQMIDKNERVDAGLATDRHEVDIKQIMDRISRREQSITDSN